MRKIYFIFVFLFLTIVLAGTNNWYIETNPSKNAPEAVWSARGTNDSSTEIKYSYFDGDGWAPSTEITSDGIDDCDPRIAFDSSGNRMVVWWTDEPNARIKYSTLSSSGGTWSIPIVISDPSENCRYPSIVFHNGMAVVCFEKIDSSGNHFIVTSHEDGPSPWPEDCVASTQRVNNLKLKIHSMDGHLWVDWVDTDSTLSYSEKINGSWQSAQSESYSDEGDIENCRQKIKTTVTGK